MGFFSRFFTNEDNYQGDEKTLDKVVNKQNGGKPKKPTVKARHAGFVYNPSHDGGGINTSSYTETEYDFPSIARAVDTDSYFGRSIGKYVELILKGGYEFIGKNIKAVKYVRERFRQMAQVSDVPTDQLLKEITTQLVTYSNTYVSKVRDVKASGGRVRRTYDGALRKPVAAYFVEDTVSMRIAVGNHGDTLGYKQMIPNKSKYKVWRPWNVIHFFYDKKPGLRVGTPIVWPVLDDIRALRRMEQNVELLVFQHTIPLYQYKIGTDERPADPEEVTAMKGEIQNMPPNGCIVTPERHEVAAIGAERKALDATKYMEYFRDRIFAGLGMSPTAMGIGDTSNKATAKVGEAHMQNTAMSFQKVVSMFVNEFMIKELLLEGGFTWSEYNKDNLVHLYFPPIDEETQQAKENHYSQLYAQHAVTEDELREELGRDPITTSDRKNMYFELVAKPMAIIKAMDESFQGGSSPATKSGEQKNQPKNQYGKKPAKPKYPANDKFIKINKIYDDTRMDVINAYEDYRSGDKFGTSNLNPIFRISKKIIKETIEDSSIASNCYEALDKAMDRVKSVFSITNKYEGICRIDSIFKSSKPMILKEVCDEKISSND